MAPDSRPPTAGPPACTVLTPAGRGAIATIAVRGAGAIAAVSRRFKPVAGKPLESFEVGRVLLGRFQFSNAASEELVVGVVAPDEVELHCHGGAAMVVAVRDGVAAEGCAVVSPERWVHRQAADPIANQALLALGDARTERTAAILLDQVRGALQNELLWIRRLLALGHAADAKASMEKLRALAGIGAHLTQPWKVVLAGPPNAGKSSLANAILGYERAIVFPQPGTTRDVLTATTAIGGWTVELADVAGLRTAADALEAAGIERARGQISAAEMVIYVAATNEPFSATLLAEVTQLCEGRLFIAYNKCDLRPPPDDGRPAGIQVSAATGAGLDELCASMMHRFVPAPPPRGAAVPFTLEQVAALNQAAAHLAHGDDAAADKQIAGLLGQTDDSDCNRGPGTR